MIGNKAGWTKKASVSSDPANTETSMANLDDVKSFALENAELNDVQRKEVEMSKSNQDVWEVLQSIGWSWEDIKRGYLQYLRG